MKIICTLNEYSQLVRMCQRNLVLNECKDCVMENRRKGANRWDN